MATPSDDATTTDHQERLIALMEQAHASSLLQLEAAKLKISHYEKLAILSASTLALSFTAATAFHIDRAHVASSIFGLFLAWKLLMSAIVLAVISNWLSVTGVIHFGNYMFNKQVGVRFDLLEVPLKKLNPNYALQEREGWDKYAAKYANSSRYFNLFNRLAGVVGLLAQLTAFGAFVSLYFFAKAVLVSP